MHWRLGEGCLPPSPAELIHLISPTPAVHSPRSGNDDGCGRGSSAFNVKVPTLTANRWYYIVVAPYSATGTTPKLRLTVSGQKRS